MTYEMERLARDILDLATEVRILRAENKRLKAENQRYFDMIAESNKASGQQLVGWIDKIMDGSLSINKAPDAARTT